MAEVWQKVLRALLETRDKHKWEVNRVKEWDITIDISRADYAIPVTWWKQVKGKLGTTCTMWGVVKWIDQNGRRIKLVTDEDSQWISMDQITAVKVD
ncbi:YolD-like family protein [Brevibacillus brevis]|uniref:YolD-like family protein n=1 Tax=Brevibacillus brevis TaxID=1393 RepID=UPI0021BDC490|nr:YolD-like family protein [Brevibacillus brevis]